MPPCTVVDSSELYRNRVKTWETASKNLLGCFVSVAVDVNFRMFLEHTAWQFFKVYDSSCYFINSCTKIKLKNATIYRIYII